VKLLQNIFSKEPPLRLYQLHEHLANMAAGPQPFEPGPSLKNACIKAGKNVWRHTGLSRWGSREREAQYFYKYGLGTHGFMHINADHENCFLVIIFDQITSCPIGYLLFDIGAEYTKPIYVCPAIGFEGSPTEEIIETSVPNLMTSKDAFAIMDMGAGTYMQALQTRDNAYRLEHQLVNTANHYEAVSELSAQHVIAALKSYAFGKKEWASDIAWRKVDL